MVSKVCNQLWLRSLSILRSRMRKVRIIMISQCNNNILWQIKGLWWWARLCNSSKIKLRTPRVKSLVIWLISIIIIIGRREISKRYHRFKYCLFLFFQALIKILSTQRMLWITMAMARTIMVTVRITMATEKRIHKKTSTMISLSIILGWTRMIRITISILLARSMIALLYLRRRNWIRRWNRLLRS